jgi:hypothetical protein
MMPKRFLTLFLLFFMMFSCKKDDGGYTQIKGIENLVYLSIKQYRENNGLTGPFVHQYIMVREAQLYSYRLAWGMEPFGTQGLEDHWNTIHEKIGGYNDQALVLRTDSNNEDEIFSSLLQIPGADSIFLEDLTQCGVGIEADTAGFNYVTILMMKVD